MKSTLCFILLLFGIFISGCAAPPVAMDDSMQRKLITRCDNDMFCFRKSYDVAMDSWCQSDCNYQTSCKGGFPVSYRSKESVYENHPNGYQVTLPAGGNVISTDKPKGVSNE